MRNQLARMRGHVFKILPLYEEGADWMQHLQLVTLELRGFYNQTQDPRIFMILCRISGIDERVKKTTLKSTVLKCTRILS
ncbi:MAG: hypothetical protein ACRCZZ_06080, partial [Phocaeicola sp.]